MSSRLTDLPNYGSPGDVQNPCREIKLEFLHGLGDCVNFAYQLPIFLSRGYNVGIYCRPEIQDIFRAAGAEILDKPPGTQHAWQEVILQTEEGPFQLHNNKSARNLTCKYVPLLPEFQRGEDMDIWHEYCNLSLDFSRFCDEEDRETIDRFLDDFRDMQIIVLHTLGNTVREEKSLTKEETTELQKLLINTTDAAIIILDWHREVELIRSWRIRRYSDPKLSRLWCLMQRANLVMGIDSGPLHFARFTDTNALGIWPGYHYHPWNYLLPRTNTLNATPHRAHKLNKYHRIAWNIYECFGGGRIRMPDLADLAPQMLGESKYLPYLVQDIQLRQFLHKTRSCDASLSEYVDRDRGFQCMFKRLNKPRPHIVEVGTIRAEEDWRGAGFSTYLFAFFTHYAGGRLTTVDTNPKSIEFANFWCSPFNSVKYHCCTGEKYLELPDIPIDLLYLDGHDTYEEGFAETGLRESQKGIHRMSSSGIIAMDDTVYSDGKWRGKGELAVPWLLENGWRVIYSGYQTVLARQPEQTPLFGLFQKGEERRQGEENQEHPEIVPDSSQEST